MAPAADQRPAAPPSAHAAPAAHAAQRPGLREASRLGRRGAWRAGLLRAPLTGLRERWRAALPAVLGVLLLVGLPARGGAAPGAPDDPAGAIHGVREAREAREVREAHELHETYAELAIEGSTVAGRIQFYKKDLERALGSLLNVDAVALAPGPEADALVLRYLEDRLRLVAGGEPLAPTLLRTEEVRLAHHAGWQVTLSWEAESSVASLAVRNTLLFELHDDQRNVMRFVRFPQETRQTVTTEAGAPEAVVDVGTGR